MNGIIDPDMTNSEEPPCNKKQAAVMEWLLGKLETSFKIPFRYDLAKVLKIFFKRLKNLQLFTKQCDQNR